MPAIATGVSAPGVRVGPHSGRDGASCRPPPVRGRVVADACDRTMPAARRTPRGAISAVASPSPERRLGRCAAFSRALRLPSRRVLRGRRPGVVSRFRERRARARPALTVPPRPPGRRTRRHVVLSGAPWPPPSRRARRRVLLAGASLAEGASVAVWPPGRGRGRCLGRESTRTRWGLPGAGVNPWRVLCVLIAGYVRVSWRVVANPPKKRRRRFVTGAVRTAAFPLWVVRLFRGYVSRQDM